MSRFPSRLVLLPCVALGAVIAAACGTSTSESLDTLPPIRTTTSTTTPSTTVDPREIVYVVQSGDNVNEIARAYETSAALIIELNGLPPDGRIQPGQELEIPNVRVDNTLPTPSSTEDP